MSNALAMFESLQAVSSGEVSAFKTFRASACLAVDAATDLTHFETTSCGAELR
jgi:hypothetical protein